MDVYINNWGLARDADAVERTGEAADGSEADAPVDAAAEQAIEKIDSGSEL